MNVKTFVLTVAAILCYVCSITAQAKEMKRAVSQGKNSNLTYEARFKNPKNAEKVQTWCDDNGYTLLTYLKGEIVRFGGVENGIVGARFATHADYAYLIEQERKRQEQYAQARQRAAQNNSSINWGKLAKGAAIVAGIAGTGWVVSKLLGKPSSGYSSSSSSSYHTESQPSSSSTYSSEESNSNSNQLACYEYLGKKSYGVRVYFESGGSTESHPVYKVKCSDGKENVFYLLSKGESQPILIGGKRTNCVVLNGDYFSKLTSKEEAMIAICNCN